MLNNITIMGRMVREPELRYTRSEVPVTGFTVAVDRDYQSENGQKQTDFIDCAAWRGLAEFVSRYFHKGSMVAVSGRLQAHRWEDKDGNKRTGWSIKVENVYFCDSKKPEKAAEPERAPAPAGYSSYAPADYSYTPTFMDLDYEDVEHPF